MKRWMTLLLTAALLLSVLPIPLRVSAAEPIIYDDPDEPRVSTLDHVSAEDATIIEGSWQVPGETGRYDLQALLPDLSFSRWVIPPGYSEFSEPVDLEEDYWTFSQSFREITLIELDSQDEEPWGLGSHAVRLCCTDYSDEEYTADFHIVIVSSPVASITAEDRTCIVNWDDLAQPAEDGTPRREVDYASPGYGLVLNDGSVLNDYEAEALARQYHEHPSFAPADSGEWVHEALTAGDVHTAVCSMFGRTAEYEVTAVPSPVDSMILPESISVYYTDFDPKQDLIDVFSFTLRQDAEYVPAHEYGTMEDWIFLYSQVLLSDGRILEYGDRCSRQDQVLTFNFLGAERTVAVEFLPSPVVTLSLEKNVLWQELDEASMPNESYQTMLCGYQLGSLPVVAVLADGAELHCALCELPWELRILLNADCDMRLDAENAAEYWDVGEHSFFLSLFDAEYELSVTVVENVVADFTLEDMTLDQYTCGSWQPVLDEDGNPVPDQYWFHYDAPRITVLLKDGSTFVGTAEEVSEHFGRDASVTFRTKKRYVYNSQNDGLLPQKYEVEVIFCNMIDSCRLTICPDLAFTDVPMDAYYTFPVAWAVEKGITSGTSADKFSPNQTCTREQVVTFLYAAAGKPSYSLTEFPFTDVKKGSYYYDAVMWALENKITSGVTKTRFGVKESCTREQVMTFLYKMEGSPSREYFESYNGNPFTDVIQGKYYYPAVMFAHYNYLAAGVSSTLFGVGKPCTRAQIVTFLYAFFG